MAASLTELISDGLLEILELLELLELPELWFSLAESK